MQDGHSTKTWGRAPCHGCAWLGQGWVLGAGAPAPRGHQPRLGFGIAFASSGPCITNIFSLRGLHLPPSGGSSTAWVWSLIKLAKK